MKKLYVVNKTHFDVGFTDLAANIFERYCKEYIPNAITLAEELNENNEKFVWTTGSYLIKYFLDNENKENVERLENAIENGYIRWHGIPFTFQTEMLSTELCDYMFSISKELDERFGITTTSSKMTDVPGHTKGLIKYMHKHGIKFIHIGVNGVSAIPDVPETFLWKDGDAEVIVSYSNDYGGTISVPFLDEKMIFMHTHDNSGPGTLEKVTNFMENTREEFPDYEIISSSMDDFANILWENKDKLPIVTEEIGDTWIHGVMSDPELVRMYQNFIYHIKDNEVSKEAMFNALLIPEHTWGMDIKRYFSDYLNYDKDSFQKARIKDIITDEDLNGYEIVKEQTLGEMKFTNFEWEDRSYKLYESSWKEKRDNINKVYACLDADTKQTLVDLNKIPSFTNLDISTEIGEVFNINGYNVSVNKEGALSLVEKDDIKYFDQDNCCGTLNYTVCGIDDYDSYRNNYLRDKSWWRIDMLKPGMELQIPVPLNTNFNPMVKSITRSNNQLKIDVIFDQTAINNYGAPRSISYLYTFEDSITFEATLKDKDAIRLPEIMSFNITPIINNDYRLLMSKLGTIISPLDVVNKGNGMQHYVENISYNASDRNIRITPITSPLCSFGTNNNLLYKNDYRPNIRDMHFILLNTTWGTNFTMWYEEDMHTKFIIEIK